MIPLTKKHDKNKVFKLALRKYSQIEHLKSTPPAVSGQRNQYSSLMSDLLTDFLRFWI